MGKKTSRDGFSRLSGKLSLIFSSGSRWEEWRWVEKGQRVEPSSRFSLFRPFRMFVENRSRAIFQVSLKTYKLPSPDNKFTARAWLWPFDRVTWALVFPREAKKSLPIAWGKVIFDEPFWAGKNKISWEKPKTTLIATSLNTPTPQWGVWDATNLLRREKY